MQGYVVIGTELDTKEFDAQIDYVKGQLEDIEDTLKKADMGFEVGDTQKLEAQYEKLSNKLKDLIKKKNEFNNIGTTPNLVNNIGQSMQGIIKSVTKWGLALFGIRTAYSFIRNVISQVTQEDQAMANQIQYISFAIGTVLKPIVEWLINAVYKILSVFGGIIKAITGINIFAKATASNFAKANSSAGALRKTLAGFDEMNVLNENGSTGLLGSGVGDWIPPDLPDKVEEIMKKIKDWFTKGLPTREELEGNANTYKTSWIKVGEFLGLGTIFNDFRAKLNELKEELRPLWQPILDGFNYYGNTVKSYFKPFTDYVEEHLLKPIKEKTTTWKDGFLSRYAKFINKLIYFANLFLQYFGIQLDYIDEESGITGEDIEKNIGGALEKVKKDSDKTKTGLDNLYDKLKELTSKSWNINTIFTSSGVSNNTANSWLQPLRDKLAQLGIKLPFLASGGIVNMPGRGVPIGSAISGERGAEGVIPLTDSQQMALLGEAIGKYITINANITNTMNGRVISRELQKVQNETNFAMNR